MGRHIEDLEIKKVILGLLLGLRPVVPQERQSRGVGGVLIQR
jgi:hypothetical protein